MYGWPMARNRNWNTEQVFYIRISHIWIFFIFLFFWFFLCIRRISEIHPSIVDFFYYLPYFCISVFPICCYSLVLKVESFLLSNNSFSSFYWHLNSRCKSAVRFITFSPSGRHMIYCCDDATIYIWRIKTTVVA